MTAAATGPALNLTAPEVLIAGRALSAAWLTYLKDIRVERGVRTIGRAVIQFWDPDRELSESSQCRIGDEVSIVSANGKKYFVGTISRRTVSTENLDTTFSITVRDRAAELVGGTMATAHAQSTLSDVLSAVVRSTTLSLQVPATAGPLPWLGASGSRLSVIDEIAGRCGFDWEVHDTALKMWDAAAGAPTDATNATVTVGIDLIAFSVDVTNDHARRVEVRSWNHETLLADSKAPKNPQPSRAESAWVPPVQAGTLPLSVHSRGDAVVPTEATQLAEAFAGTGQRVRAQGRALMDPSIAPGGQLTVAGGGRTDGAYYVREVEHYWGPAQSWTRFVAGDRDAPTLVDPWQQSPTTSTYGHQHLTIGVVTQVGVDPAASNATPEEPISAKVTFPMLGEQFGSAWARIVMAGAGRGRGLAATPAVDDEVLVAFVDGDFRRPVILGGLHGPKNPIRPTGMVQSRAASTSLTSHGKNVVELSDGDGVTTQHIALTLGNGPQFIRLGKDKVQISVPNDVPLQLGNGQASITIDGGKVTISAQELVVDAKQSISLKGNEVTVSATSAAKIESRATLNLKAGATGAVEASGPLTLKGAIVSIN